MMNHGARNVLYTLSLAIIVSAAYFKVSIENQQLKPKTAVLSDIATQAPEEAQHQHDSTTKATGKAFLKQYELASENKSDSSDALNLQEEFALLERPEVIAYLDHERDKAALDSYFNDDQSSETYSDQQIWDIIERVEAEGRVFAFEALSLKLRWLEKNALDESDFKIRSEEIINHYRERALAAQENYDPNDTPGFSEYKKEEARIIKEANEMQVYPEGMSKQEYLRQELLAARVRAYGA